MIINRLSNTATIEEVSASLKEHGYVVIDELVSTEVMDKVAAEMGPYIETTPFGEDKFVGFSTKRTGAMILRSETSRELIMNPLVVGVAANHLSKASTFQLHLTQVITVHPGSPAQVLHQDQLAWDFFQFPNDYEVQCNTLWAMTDYTAENGATRLVPDSQFAGTGQKFPPEAGIPAEMKKGSVLLYTGKIYHGAGENKTDKVRQALNITYAVGWLRQEENQYLATPPEVARTLPDDLLKLMGYQCGCFAMGYVRDFEDPLAYLKGSTERRSSGFNALSSTANENSADYANSLV
ncbi:phytanoyl-CoA dioxygenase family protein [Pseudomonas veronii]|uniref:phytanoyl-CoA dioxygenase family protein n=1 Tax=Pseudomonas TaxID=286 RepID=UPI000F83427C|nr:MULTISPECIES: phytanoyl-CoA dioxygenase family protein [Pseudomonas]MDY7552271.1 phytanoyl-CoA dioxygenase family protein [Pseudomonas sp. FG1]MEB0051374.1 phytanoyl-CoA dioxygenase family protein [Pseudomonas sp. FG1]RTY61667.1 phytanoyl-CoA dioxygenase family protein [Pseudomonas veronii]